MYRIAVIGGGPAGYAAAIRATQLGAETVLFEKETLGGTCLNRGCIPTKTLLSTADTIMKIRNASIRGIINQPDTAVDMKKVTAYKDKVVRQLTDGVAVLLRTNGVKVVHGDAVLQDNHTVFCCGETYQAESVILCSGSGAARIPVPGVNHPAVVTSTELLDLQILPKHLCIIGGGVIGCEFASIFRTFGCEVTVIEGQDRLIPMMEKDFSSALRRSMKKQGINVLLSSMIKEIRDHEGNAVICCENGNTVEADKVLLSIGRKSDLDCLGELKDQILTKGGYVCTDDTLRTSVPNIFAAGDITGRSMLAHSAYKMGETAAENAAANTFKTADLQFVPTVVFCEPPMASVGLSEEEAKQYGDRLRIGKFPFSANGRALSCGEADGYVKVLMDAEDRKFLGVHICGSPAPELISEAAAMMDAGVTVDEAASMIHAHPSFAEAFMEACGDAVGKCIHLPPRK